MKKRSALTMTSVSRQGRGRKRPRPQVQQFFLLRNSVRELYNVMDEDEKYISIGELPYHLPRVIVDFSNIRMDVVNWLNLEKEAGRNASDQHINLISLIMCIEDKITALNRQLSKITARSYQYKLNEAPEKLSDEKHTEAIKNAVPQKRKILLIRNCLSDYNKNDDDIIVLLARHDHYGIIESLINEHDEIEWETYLDAAKKGTRSYEAIRQFKIEQDLAFFWDTLGPLN